ncbi:MAG: hypothetical protein HFG49_03180 [Lachnospiraceae bacterium]|jgi:pyruvate-formate lyase|nr:hypothetical protein [Lachnospiraceae bacterium]
MQPRVIPGDFKENGVDKSYDEIFSLICKNIEVSIQKKRFVYFIDEHYVMDTTKGFRLENLTPAYDKILHSGLKQLKYPEQEITNDFCRSYNRVIDQLSILVQRILKKLEENGADCAKQKEWFMNLPDSPAKGFEEAIQRMLFLNQIFWQTDHRLTGLGAWDSFLYPYYEAELSAGLLTRQEALEILKDLYRTLHENYDYKSNVLMGDTGQIFVLGKSDEKGNYICNDLTYLFIEAMKEVQLSDPKCLLRVNQNTPRKLMELALESIVTGIGAPLLANDDVIIPNLLEFGISKEDAYEYTTSACWEPLIGGKSSSPNNMMVLNYLKPLDHLLKRDRLERIKTFDELINRYLLYLQGALNEIKRQLSSIRFPYNPFLSVFLYDCYENKKDVSWGGARYHHMGITSVAMGNLINSLLNIKELVFDTHQYTLYDVKQMVILDFEGKEEVRTQLKARSSQWGIDEENIISLANRITSFVSEEISDYRSYLGGSLKVGLSGSAYLDAAKEYGASFDGRRAGEPFIVHISNEDNDGFTEIISFASQLEYGKSRFNGNVVDFMVSPDFVQNNWDKFLDFLMLCIRKGFFEMQMNVVSSKTLIEARKHPEDFPNLIVRVWGFSAYFNDLPEDYKKVLIKRALRNEGAA